MSCKIVVVRGLDDAVDVGLGVGAAAAEAAEADRP